MKSFAISVAIPIIALFAVSQQPQSEAAGIGTQIPQELRSTVDQIVQAWQSPNQAPPQLFSRSAKLVSENGVAVKGSASEWFSAHRLLGQPGIALVFSAEKAAVVRLTAKGGETKPPTSINATLIKHPEGWRVSLLQIPRDEGPNYIAIRGLPVNVPGGEMVRGQIGHISMCWGWQVVGHVETVYWGDNYHDQGNMWPEPMSEGKFVAGHRYLAPLGQNVITMQVDASCYHKDGDIDIWTNESAVGNTIVNRYVPDTLVSLQLVPSTVQGGKTVQGIVTVNCPAPPWGTVVDLHSSDWDRAVPPPQVTIQPNAIQFSAAFDIKTYTTPGKVEITASIPGIGNTPIKQVLTIK
jgi:hypothetical protein